jgi:DNA-binding transcriptional LysR family regulator
MHRSPTFLALRAFEAAARAGGFTAAGQELNLTPSAISHQIRALETHFGRKLFTRRGIKVVLNADGARLAEALTIGFNTIHHACKEFAAGAQQQQLAVHCAPSFASKWLGPRLPAFMRLHPEITLRLTSGAAPVDLLRHEELDLVISYGSARRRPGLVVETFGPEDIIALCTAELAARVAPSTPEINALLIVSSVNPVGWNDWFAVNELPRPDPIRGPAYDRGALAVSAAAQGLGISLESRCFAIDELESGVLVEWGGGRFKNITRDMHFLSYREAQKASPPIMAFRQWLKLGLGS